MFLNGKLCFKQKTPKNIITYVQRPLRSAIQVYIPLCVPVFCCFHLLYFRFRCPYVFDNTIHSHPSLLSDYFPVGLFSITVLIIEFSLSWPFCYRISFVTLKRWKRSRCSRLCLNFHFTCRVQKFFLEFSVWKLPNIFPLLFCRVVFPGV